MRSDQPGGALRGCPTCGTKVADIDIGLRDFAWLNDVLPGRVGGMDLDLVLTNNTLGEGLAIELKPLGAYVSTGARLTLKFLVQHGFTCLIVWEHPNGHVDAARVERDGTFSPIWTESCDDLARRILLWWNGNAKAF